MVDCTGLENRQPERVREFESHRFRQKMGIESSTPKKPVIRLAPTKQSLRVSMTYKVKPHMKSRTSSLLSLFVALFFSFYCAASLAIPKVAEDENAPVTTGADVAKPKLATKSTKPQTAEKNKKTSTKKPAKTSKPAKKSKTTYRRK